MSERWLWTQKEDIGASPRYGHAMAYEAAHQRVVLFGGAGGSGGTSALSNDTWGWDGVSWTQLADMGPPARRNHAMAYDESRHRLVLFGGYTPGYVGDTWEWDGTEWTQVADIGPAARMGCALVYDTVRQRVLLFGGENYTLSPPNNYFSDTWEWDGREWTQLADMGPPPRAGHAMVFDSSRECLVLFGGYWQPGAQSVVWLSDTWEWDEDAGWVKRQDMGSRSMYQPKMVHTEAHTVLFGYPEVGWGAAGGAGQTWEWDDNLWTQRQNMGPPRRSGHTLAYDSQGDRVVLFGGWGVGSLALGDTWELAIIEQ